MLIREIRKGFGYGWFSDDNTYNAYFKDADNEVSYKRDKDEQFEYLNTTRYQSPMAILNMMGEYFDTALKKRSEQDADGFTNQLRILLIHVPNDRYIRFFQNNFAGFTMEAWEKAQESFSITITTDKSIHELINYASLFCLFMVIFSEEYLDVGDAVIVKYLTVINALDAPFFIRYLFGRNVLKSRERFRKYQSELEATSRYAMKLQYGGTAVQRRDRMRSLLAFDKSILDVGCGEGFYAIPFAQNIPENLYYAVDVDERAVNIVRQHAKDAGIENLITYTHIDAFLESYSGEKVDVIVTEVVEHMETEASGDLLKAIIQQVDFDQLIVTTPNAAFNSFYALEGFRHEDHKWEMNTDEFQAWIEEVCGSSCYTVFFGIGDCVDGIYTTQGVQLRRKEG